MIQIDVPLVFGTGTLLANAARRQLTERQPARYGQALGKVIVFHAVTFQWAALYFLIFYFGFETSHMWWHGDSVFDYPWLFPAFFFALFLSNVGGFMFGAHLVRTGRARMTWIVWAACVVFSCGWVMLLPDRTMTLGTYSDWLAGTAPSAGSDRSFMTFVGLLLTIFTAGLLYVYRSLWRDGDSSAQAR